MRHLPVCLRRGRSGDKRRPAGSVEHGILDTHWLVLAWTTAVQPELQGHLWMWEMPALYFLLLLVLLLPVLPHKFLASQAAYCADLWDAQARFVQVLLRVMLPPPF